MRPLQLDFVQQNAPSWSGMAVIVFSIFIAGLLGQYYQQLSMQSEKNASALSAVDKQMHPKPVASARSNMSQVEMAASMQSAKQTAEFLFLPWTSVFEALEASADPDVAILGIEPEPRKQLVKIIAEAKNKELMFAYIKKLEATPQLTGVYLVRHEMIEDKGQHPIRFVVAGNWVKPNYSDLIVRPVENSGSSENSDAEHQAETKDSGATTASKINEEKNAATRSATLKEAP